MTLEATIVILDNTEFARNGDHLPTRYEAQAETIQAIINAKQQMNIENAIGVMTMGGDQVDVLITPSPEPEAIMGCLFGVKLKGEEAHFLKALQIAQLALKHRKNKHMRQRVIVFVASPILDEERNLEKVAKQLKKNNLSVDVVNLCQSGENVAKLEKFIEHVNSGENSHFLNAETGITSLNERLFNSPILNAFASNSAQQAAQSGSAATSAAGQASSSSANPAFVENPFAEFGGIDPSEDPELAQVMKLSLEEERRRLESERADAAVATNQSAMQAETEAVDQGILATDANNQSVLNTQQNQLNSSIVDEHRGLLDNDAAQGADQDEEFDEEELMRQAILASQQEYPACVMKETQMETESAPLLDQKQGNQPTEEQLQADIMQDEDFVEGLLKLVNKEKEDKHDSEGDKK